MTKTKILKVVGLYEKKLTTLLKSKAWEDNAKLKQVLEMCEHAREILNSRSEGSTDLDKAHRRLGFIQGVLWCEGIYTISEMREHNRQTRDDILEEYKGHSLSQFAPCSACGDLDGCHKWRKLEKAAAA